MTTLRKKHETEKSELDRRHKEEEDKVKRSKTQKKGLNAMMSRRYRSMESRFSLNRRQFFKAGGAAGAAAGLGLLAGRSLVFAQNAAPG